MGISQINLGSFYTNSNGTSVSNGVSSGLDTNALITALTSGQASQIKSLNDQATLNNSQSTALSSLNTALSTLQRAITPLSNPTSPDSSNNLFAVSNSQVTSNTTQAASNYITATVASGTANGNYVINNITKIATNTTEESNAFTLANASDSVVKATPTAGYFSAGTIVVKGQNITISAGDSLSTIAQSFNNVASTTGIGASVLQTAPGVYKLIFTSTATGYNSRFSLADAGTVTSDPSGVLTNLTFKNDQQGNNASFDLNGVTITRSSNSINDLVSGVTINLLQDTVSTPGASFTLSISPDTTSLVQGINNFAAAYNNFLYFYSQQTELDVNSKPKSTAILNSDDTLRSIYKTVTSTVSSLVNGLANGQPNTLAALGITFTDAAATTTTPATPNILSVDSSVLLSALQTNFSGVEKVFGDGFKSSSANLGLFHNATDLQGITSLTLNVTQSTDPKTYVGTYTDSLGATKTVNFTANPLSSGGVSLAADPKSALAGMSLIYTGTGDEPNITVSLTQGIVSKLQNIVDSSVKASTGLIARDKQTLVEKNNTIQKQITTVTDQMTAQKKILLDKYSALEAAISKSNSMLNYLNAQQVARSG